MKKTYTMPEMREKKFSYEKTIAMIVDSGVTTEDNLSKGRGDELLDMEPSNDTWSNGLW